AQEGDRLVVDGQGKTFPVDIQDEAMRQLCTAPRQVTWVIGDLLLFLEGGDLGVVDDVNDIDPIAVELDLAEPVDREVAQRVGEGRHGGGQRKPDSSKQPEQGAPHAHAVALNEARVRRRTGAQSSGQEGLMWSAVWRSAMAV